MENARHGTRDERGKVGRRAVLGAGVAGVAAAGGAAAYWQRQHGDRSAAPSPATSPASAAGGPSGTAPPPPSTASPTPSVRLIGDGSTADTGPQPQPHRRTAERLQPGTRPPQFVVISWDGAGALDDGLFPRFRRIAADTKSSMTFFLSGIYLLPESKKRLYRPPNNPVGASAIGYLTDAHIRATLGQVAAAWKEGHEIGTHFNGHFCSGSGSVAHWTPAQWHSEIDQAMAFVSRWKTNTGFSDIDPLPFDYAKELTGGRTPCLLGQDNLLPTAKALGWRYDASSPGGIQTWPRRRGGLWDFPLQALPFPGHSFEVLSMDYNMMANQSGNSTQGAKSSRPSWRDQARKAYLAGFDRAYHGNRAPLFIGNHFEHWNGGIYMDAVQDVIEHIAGQPEVEMVSFRQMCDWLDAQDPGVLTALQSLNVGKAPASGWQRLTSA